MIWDNNEDIKVINCPNHRKTIRKLLLDNREERRPYLFITDTMTVSPLSTILIPISRLQEETYKSDICTYIARRTNVQCILLCANDYGSMAKTNTNKIITHFKNISTKTGIDFSYKTELAKKNSDKLIYETVDRCKEFHADLIILTASREYGLDDIIFGPPELYAIRNSQVPVMLVNPRADLFSLCD